MWQASSRTDPMSAATDPLQAESATFIAGFRDSIEPDYHIDDSSIVAHSLAGVRGK